MYHDLAGIWQGFAKNAAAAARYTAGRGLPTVLGSLLATLAVPCLLYGMVTGSRVFVLAALVTYVISVSELFLWNILFETAILDGLFQPLASVVFLAIAIDSLVRRGRHIWKGRLI